VRPGTAYSIFALADDDFGVKSVAFTAGATALGSDATGPYEAPLQWTPGAELEGQDVALTATITDSAGQVTTRSVAVTVLTPAPVVTPQAVAAIPAPAPASKAKPQPPSRVTLAASAARNRRLTLSGVVTAPACGGSVRLSIYYRGALLRRVTAVVGADCRYRTTLTLTRLAAGDKVTVKARFLTAGDLLARSAPTRSVSVKR
jgi:hypothetical protein